MHPLKGKASRRSKAHGDRAILAQAIRLGTLLAIAIVILALYLLRKGGTP